ncbi:SGNH/GDSL hydrolase family protein [Enterococcus faecalis]|uniref:SGNH/GDSL hydrolase family protein n=1 Tax=Enterococcus faecalis TaxID=1351 RepID=UPI003F23728E
MKKQTQHILLTVLTPILIALGVFTLLRVAIPKAKPLLKQEKVATTAQKNQKEVIHYTAIGDSLTEGIGDLTNSGGFVPIVADDLKEHYNLNGVQTDNFGKNGDRSDQILKRIKEKPEIQKGLASADVITLTVGGNDLMKVISSNIFDLKVSSFNRPQKAYQRRVRRLLEEIREYNEKAPIYVLGIYNPFYLNFSEITEMQEIVDNWNQATEEMVQEQKRAYFIPINDLLYKGRGDEVGVTGDDSETTGSSASKEDLNNLLYEEDRFHPNNLGYQIMAGAVRDEMVKTEKEWITKSEGSE